MRRLALFARWPVPGQVKTRLSPALPPALACELYRAMLADALGAMSTSTADERWIYWTGEPPVPGERDLAGAGLALDESETRTAFQVREQQGDDLGARLERAFDELLASPADRAVVIGGDCPDLGPSEITAAFTALERHDLVLGPAVDGGYYLIGLARRAPELFRGIAWGTESVFDQTIARAGRAAITRTTLARLDDLDTPQALLHWLAQRATRGGTGAAHTSAALAKMGLLASA